MLDVGQGGVEWEREHVPAIGDALSKGGVRKELQHASEVGLADQDESGQGLAVELGGEQGAQGIDEGIGEEMRLVDDDHGGSALGLNEIGAVNTQSTQSIP